MSATPLAGLRVVELTHMIMGPSCGLVLADLGADVVKVEPPAGDNTRRLTGAGAGFFAAFNRNKRSLAIDLKGADLKDGGIGVVRRLAERADVLIENFRPGALDKLGLGYPALREANPRLVYCSLKGFLPGPYEHRAALDEVVQMMGGLAYMTGPPGQPLRAGSSVVDIVGGFAGAIAILGAIEERHRTGRGAHVQAGLFESVALLMAQHVAQYAVSGQEPPPMSARQVAWPIYDVFATADDGQLFVGVVTDTQWRLFCEAFGLKALLDDPALGSQAERLAARPRVLPIVAAALRQHTRDDLAARLDQLGLPYAPIARPVDLLDDPHLLGSNGLVPLTLPSGERTRLPALPVAFDGERPALRHDLPGIGEHTEEILRELGWAQDTE